MNNYNFHDSTILSVKINISSVDVLLELWDSKRINLKFEQALATQALCCIGATLDKIIINSSGELIDKLNDFFIKDGGSPIKENQFNLYEFVTADELTVLTIAAFSFSEY